MIPRKCGINFFWQSGRLVDPLCQHSTEEHMHPGCGHFNHPGVTEYQSCKFQIYYLTKSHGSYVCSIYILLRNIFLFHIYFGHKYIFDASILWKEMVDILLLIFLQLSQVAPSLVDVSGACSCGCQWYRPSLSLINWMKNRTFIEIITARFK